MFLRRKAFLIGEARVGVLWNDEDLSGGLELMRTRHEELQTVRDVAFGCTALDRKSVV